MPETYHRLKISTEPSKYNNWQIFLLMIGVVIAFSDYYRINLITSFLYSLDGVAVISDYTIDNILHLTLTIVLLPYSSPR